MDYGEVRLFPDRFLGLGSYGRVCMAKYGQLPCAAKLLHEIMFGSNDPGEEALLMKFETECHILRSIKHPNIVQYLTTIRDPNTGRPVLIMELMDESLTAFLKRSVTPLPCHIQVDICHDVALALDYLHSKNIVHRDLSSNNVLLVAGKRAKVTDFGMSKLIMMGPHPMTQVPGAEVYMPPEARQRNSNYSLRLDCFSYGVLAMQIATGKYPSPGDAHRHVADPNYPKGILLPVSEMERRAESIKRMEVHNPIRGIVLACIKDEERERPSATKICNMVADVKEGNAYKSSTAVEASRQELLRELDREKRRNQELVDKRKRCQQTETNLLVQLERVEQQLRESQERETALHIALEQERCRQLPQGREQALQQKLDHHIQQSQDRERNLKQRLQAVKDEFLQKDQERVEIQHAALQFKEKEVHELREKLKDCEKFIANLQGMASNIKHPQVSPSQHAIPGLNRGISAQSEPARSPIQGNLQPALAPIVPASINLQRQPTEPSIGLVACAPSKLPEPMPVPTPDVPPIREWREAKEPPEEMTSRSGQVIARKGTAYFTQNFSVYMYMESRNKWEELSRCINKYFGIAVVNNKLTAIGGQDENKLHSKMVYTLKEPEKRWEKLLPSMNTARMHPTAVTTPTHLVVAGGTYISDDPNRSLQGYASVEVMALKTHKEWSAVCSLPEVVGYPQMKLTGQHLLLCDTVSNRVYTCSVDDLVREDGAQNKQNVWIKKANIPVQEGACLVSYEDQVLALGGLNEDAAPKDSVYCYNESSDSWKLVKTLRTARSLVLSVLCRDNVLVVVGGFKGWKPCNVTEKITLQL